MKKTLRFAAFATAMSLTFWLAKVNDAQAALPRCSVLHGNGCAPTGQQVWCDPDGGGSIKCVCASGQWDCGCDTGLFECW